jgi:hypothetical protein
VLTSAKRPWSIDSLKRLYGRAATVKEKLKISTEIRLLEASISRMLRQVKVDVPAAPSAAGRRSMPPTPGGGCVPDAVVQRWAVLMVYADDTLIPCRGRCGREKRRMPVDQPRC